MTLIYSKINYPEMSKATIDFKISLLPIHFQDKILKYNSFQKKQQRLEGLELLAKVFSDNNLSLNEIQYNSKGKPFIDLEFDFSLTYSNNNVVLCFIRSGYIGIDLEEIKPINFLDFEDYFSENEFSIINNSDNPNMIFYKFWTRKESVSKALGLGAFLDFKSFEVLENQIFLNSKNIEISSELISENYWLSKAIIKI